MIAYVILWTLAMAASLAIGHAARSAEAVQTVVSVGPAIAMVGRKALVVPIVFGIVVLSIAYLSPQPCDAFFGGGLAFSQVAGLASSIRAVFFQRHLARPSLAKGRVEYSSEMRYRLLSIEMLSFAVVFGCVFAVIHRLEFAGAALFLGSTSLGYLRRARRAAAIAST
jgi:hypothetical protein